MICWNCKLATVNSHAMANKYRLLWKHYHWIRWNKSIDSFFLCRSFHLKMASCSTTIYHKWKKKELKLIGNLECLAKWRWMSWTKHWDKHRVCVGINNSTWPTLWRTLWTYNISNVELFDIFILALIFQPMNRMCTQ